MKSRLLFVVIPGLLVSTAVAQAHIKVAFPPSRIVENNLGDPQKAFPCGGSATATLSRIRTKFRPGQTIMVEWSETIYHTGHFRIAFDDDGVDAFRDPTSITNIVEPPVLPILKDGLFANRQPAQRMMQTAITLPNVTCRNCTLQIIQVMTDKPPYAPNGTGDDMYYHCADIELSNDAAADGGVRDGGGGVRDAGRGPDTRPPGMGGTGGGGGGTGGASGSGGAAPVAGSGGPAPAGTGGGGAVAGAGGSPAPAPGGDDAGGFCSIGGRDQKPVFALAFVGVMTALAWRSRRRRRD